MSRKPIGKATKRLTSADVARVSGVSRATVSYVLNDDPRQSIAPETRARVLEAARRLGYRPFAPARVLRAGYSQLVLGVLQFEQVDPNAARDMHFLEAGLATHQLSLVWYVGSRVAAGGQHPSANLAPAVVVSSVDEADPKAAAFLRQFGVPVLSMSTESGREAVGRAQVAYLAERGKRSMVFAASERRDVQRLCQARLDGVQQECAARELEPPFVQAVPSSREGAREAIAKVLAYQSPPLGICCYNDEVAFAVLAALSDARISVPESMAVIGCDDIPLAMFANPPLTTIAFNNRPFLELLIGNIVAASHGELPKEIPPIPLSVVVRGSV